MERKQSLDKPETAKEWLRELLTVTRRLLTNRVWMFNLGSTVFFLFGLIGFFTFLPKYFEFHFRQTASNVGAAGGLTKAGAAVLGIFVSGK